VTTTPPPRRPSSSGSVVTRWGIVQAWCAGAPSMRVISVTVDGRGALRVTAIDPLVGEQSEVVAGTEDPSVTVLRAIDVLGQRGLKL